jgi:outer membrane protein OmpA-like peptidoglycan-associated protein
MGVMMRDLIAEDPTELFLIEGYTDAVGAPGYNLLLSDRRAESVALAFSEYFDVPAENMVVQGYGESYLKVPTQQAELLNRRVAVRRITALVQNAAR